MTLTIILQVFVDGGPLEPEVVVLFNVSLCWFQGAEQETGQYGMLF